MRARLAFLDGPGKRSVLSAADPRAAVYPGKQADGDKAVFSDVERYESHKNHKVYYYFALFHKYVLNNETSALEYYSKMKQIVGMRKFLSRNVGADGRDVKVTDETSGVLILEGSRDIFNQIRFINRKLCEMCGYSKETLIGQRHTKIQPDIVRINHY